MDTEPTLFQRYIQRKKNSSKKPVRRDRRDNHRGHKTEAMAEKGVLKYPIIAVNDAYTKYLFDNRYGTGQSTIDGIMRATNRLIAGSVFVIARLRVVQQRNSDEGKGMGAKIIITEVNPLRGLEATMDGFDVMPMIDAARIGDIFVTATGDIDVIYKECFHNLMMGRRHFL